MSWSVLATRAGAGVDETGVLKQGTKSAGVQRQSSGTAAGIENCQVGVFGTYASRRVGAGDRGAVAAQEWAACPARRAEAHVPEWVAFQTKPQLAQQMLARAVDARVPARGVTADEVSGGDARLRAWLEEHDLAEVLAVKAPSRCGRPTSTPRRGAGGCAARAGGAPPQRPGGRQGSPGR
jgi:SRSO17 transposase